jgi:hypothetical protein
MYRSISSLNILLNTQLLFIMAIATSYNVTSTQGAREDLSNQLKRVAPEETPMYATLPQSPGPKALLNEWLVDDLPLPAYGSPRADGADLSFNSDFTNEIANRVRLGNRIQRFDRAAAVSPLSEMIDVAGPQTSLLAASKARTLITLKTDIEAAIGSTQVLDVGTSSVGDKLQGIMAWTDPTATTGAFDTSAKQGFRSIGGSNAQDGSAANSRFDFTSNTLTEAHFRNLLQTVYEGGGKSGSYKLFAGSSLVNQLTDFSRATNAVGSTGVKFDADVNGGTVRLSVVKLVTDFGEVDILPTLFLSRSSGSALGAAGRKAGVLIPNDDTVSLKIMEPTNLIDLPDVGNGGSRFVARTHLTLCVLNPRALGSIV